MKSFADIIDEVIDKDGFPRTGQTRPDRVRDVIPGEEVRVNKKLKAMEEMGITLPKTEQKRKQFLTKWEKGTAEIEKSGITPKKFADMMNLLEKVEGTGKKQTTKKKKKKAVIPVPLPKKRVGVKEVTEAEKKKAVSKIQKLVRSKKDKTAPATPTPTASAVEEYGKYLGAYQKATDDKVKEVKKLTKALEKAEAKVNDAIYPKTRMKRFIELAKNTQEYKSVLDELKEKGVKLPKKEQEKADSFLEKWETEMGKLATAMEDRAIEALKLDEDAFQVKKTMKEMIEEVEERAEAEEAEEDARQMREYREGVERGKMGDEDIKPKKKEKTQPPKKPRKKKDPVPASKEEAVQERIDKLEEASADVAEMTQAEQKVQPVMGSGKKTHISGVPVENIKKAYDLLRDEVRKMDNINKIHDLMATSGKLIAKKVRSQRFNTPNQLKPNEIDPQKLLGEGKHNWVMERRFM